MRLPNLSLSKFRWIGCSLILLLSSESPMVPSQLRFDDQNRQVRSLAGNAIGAAYNQVSQEESQQSPELSSEAKSSVSPTVLYSAFSVGLLVLLVVLFANRSRLRQLTRRLEQQNEANRLDQEKRRLLHERFMSMQQMESHGVLVGGIAHDFNNLLVGVMCNAELLELEASNLSPHINERVSQILSSAERAAELSKKMLAISSNARSEGRSPQHLASLVQRIEPVLAVVVGEDYPLVIETSDQDLVAEVNPVQLEQLLVSLITHIRNASPKGSTLRVMGGRSTVTDRHGHPRLFGSRKSGGDFVFLEINNSSNRIHPTAVDQTVEAFRSDSGKGQSLGLSLVHGIINAHGGLIEILCQAEKGSQIRILLPAADPIERSDA